MTSATRVMHFTAAGWGLANQSVPAAELEGAAMKLANRIAGAKPLRRGAPNIPVLSAAQVMELQQLLVRHGFLTAKPDGKLGLTTRASVRLAQMKLGLPADSYPTPELIERLRRP